MSAVNVNEPRKKGCYLGAPEVFSLGLICAQISKSFGEHCCYLVGSVLERPNFRDVDIRLILPDAKYETVFGTTYAEGSLFWSLTCTAFSEYIEKRTGLNIDFQIQSSSKANGKQHGDKPREPLGLYPSGGEPLWRSLDYKDAPLVIDGDGASSEGDAE